MIKKKWFVLPIMTFAVVAFCLVPKTNIVLAESDVIEQEVNGVVTKTLQFYEQIPDEYKTAYKTENIGKIEDQGYHGDCWAFGALATLQINLNKMGFVNTNSDDGFYDFSESALVKYDFAKYCYDCHSANIKFDEETQKYVCEDCGHDAIGYTQGAYNSVNEAGGWLSTAVNYLISNPILTDQSVWEYNSKFPIIPEPEGDYPKYSFSINSVYESNGFDVDELKSMVYSFGGVFLGHIIYNRSIAMTTYTDQDSNSYLTFCGENLPMDGGHGVCIVGYDDNFSKSKFKINKSQIISYLEQESAYGVSKEFIDALKTFDIYSAVQDLEFADPNYISTAIGVIQDMTDEQVFEKYGPQTDGAFLVKNSWGTSSQSTSGCYWLPYDQIGGMAGGENCFAFNSISATPICETEYALDELGARNAITDEDLNAENNDLGYYGFANVFNFEKNSKIDYISLSTGSSVLKSSDDCTLIPNHDFNYKLFYAPVVDGKIIASQKQLLQSGLYDSTYYYSKIFLENEFIAPNKTGAIIIEIPTTEKFALGVDVTYDVDLAIVHEKESFMLVEEQYEQAKFKNKICNFCLRVGVTETTDEANVFGANYSAYNQLKNLIEIQNPYNKTYTSQSWDAFVLAKNAFDNLDLNKTAWQQAEVDQVVQDCLISFISLQPDNSAKIIIASILTGLGFGVAITIFIVIVKNNNVKKIKEDENN